MSDFRPRLWAHASGLIAHTRAAYMDKFVARENIAHYRAALAEEKDEKKRKTLLRLLSEEEAKLAAALHKDQHHKQG